VVGLHLRQHHGDGLRVFVLQIVGEHRLVHVAQLVPHGATRGTADLFHQGVHLFRRHERVQQALGLLVGAHDRARRAHARDELDQQFFDDAGRHGAEAGHGLGDLLDLLVVQGFPDLGVVFAERQQDDRGLFRTGQLA
jgi:hypothetical protein